MPELVETNKAIAQMEDQLKRSQLLSIEHLEILAANTGRFQEDRFCIFYHELQLRKALAAGEDVDVEFARIKIRNYAEEQVTIFMSKDLIRNHIAAVRLPNAVRSIEEQRAIREHDAYMQRQHRETIRRLRA